jgi:hypothetical protein
MNEHASQRLCHARTGEVANIFACAPDAKVFGVKMGNNPVLSFDPSRRDQSVVSLPFLSLVWV